MRLLRILVGMAVPAISAASGRTAPAPVTWLGVLQEFEYIPGRPELRPQVRIAFRRDEPGWSALPDGIREYDRHDDAGYVAAGRRLRAMIPAHVDWTICFDGRVRGRVATVLPPGDTWEPRARGSMRIVGDPELPWVGAPSREWSTPETSPVHRPLVVASSGRCADPDGWKRAAFSRADLVAVLPAIRGVLRRTQSTPRSDLANSPDALFRPVRSYASRAGDRLLMVGYGDPVVGREPGTTFVVHVARDGRMRILGFYLTLIDAGDYDGDGHSEVVMRDQDGSEDGLVLFTKDLTARARFVWLLANEGP